MTPAPPPGQGPINPSSAFPPPPPPAGGTGGFGPPPPHMMPPPVYGPPHMMMPVPPPRRQRVVFPAIVTAVATIAFAGSLLLNVLLLIAVAGGKSDGGTAVKRTTLVDGAADQHVIAIPVAGIITDRTAERFDKLLTEAAKDKHLKAVLLEVNSPGGAVTASDEIYHRVLRFKADRPGVPVVAAMGSLATSGGYYVACAADHVVAQRTTLTANIGVLMPRFNVAKLFAEYGVEETTITSTGATFKNAGSMFKPERPEETRYIQRIADDAFAAFKDVVAAGRKLPRADVDKIADGRVMMGGEALALKLVDQIGYRDDAIAHVASTQGLSNPTVIRYEPQPTLLGALAGDGEAMGHVRPAQGLAIDRAAVEEMLTPRLMYLWRGE